MRKDSIMTPASSTDWLAITAVTLVLLACFAIRSWVLSRAVRDPRLPAGLGVCWYSARRLGARRFARLRSHLDHQDATSAYYEKLQRARREAQPFAPR
jgi:hypothetical protein